ncbi:hypothetical protein H310_09685 [Aphanomyces invadans]|uniref:Uncharacterized protein n=1 Tax=Aphanomyces invadans TaxID=157072 RepID=A0A024TTH7_9STRA|nr:hypothetical protein H310_09685 [Aphanomyces invadans]ETV97348.1 hypothetical protein H310_09685 [Aphanomyces invadans]|eukprot:XP_008874056.1 hypothetical protein H310_09685 [Aphanomyces invadans]
MENLESTSGMIKAVKLATKQELVDDLADIEEALELAACFPVITHVDPAVEQAKVQAVLDAKVAGAMTAGCGTEYALGLPKLLAKYVDVFRLTFGNDPPVDMPPKGAPHQVHQASSLQDRGYSLHQREFMQKHVEKLEKAGFIYRIPTSRWPCAPLIVRKPHTKDEFCMTVDLCPANIQTEQIA